MDPFGQNGRNWTVPMIQTISHPSSYVLKPSLRLLLKSLSFLAQSRTEITLRPIVWYFCEMDAVIGPRKYLISSGILYLTLFGGK